MLFVGFESQILAAGNDPNFSERALGIGSQQPTTSAESSTTYSTSKQLLPCSLDELSLLSDDLNVL